MTTFCRDCVHLSDRAKNQPPSQWLCTEAPRTSPDLVSGETPPYWNCYIVRRAQPGQDDCPKYEAGSNCLHPNPMPDEAVREKITSP